MWFQLNFIRKKANAKEFKGNIEIELGSWNKKRVSLDIQSPLNNSGDLRARIVANEAKADSFVDLLKTDKSLLYATIEKDISDNTLLTLGMSHQENKIKGEFKWFSGQCVPKIKKN